MKVLELSGQHVGKLVTIVDRENSYTGILWAVEHAADKAYESYLYDPEPDAIAGRKSTRVDIGHAENVALSQQATVEIIGE